MRMRMVLCNKTKSSTSLKIDSMNCYKKTLALIAVLVASIGSLFAKPEPNWMREMPLPGNNTYIYVKEAGQSENPTKAFHLALVHVFQNTASRLGLPFDSQQSLDAMQNGTSYVAISTQYSIPINVVDKYEVKMKNGKYIVYVLCQVVASKNLSPIWDRGKKEDAAFNRRCMAKSILPGMGQISKGYTTEGILTLSGEVALVGSAVGCYFLAQSQKQYLTPEYFGTETFNSAKITYYSIQTTQFVLWGAVAGLYVYNFIRAYSLDPKRTNNFAFTPSLISTPYSVAPTVGLTLNF